MSHKTIAYIDIIPYTKGSKCTMQRSIRGDNTRVYTYYNGNSLSLPLFTGFVPSLRPKGNQVAWRKGQGVPWLLAGDGYGLMVWYRQQVA